MKKAAEQGHASAQFNLGREVCQMALGVAER